MAPPTAAASHVSSAPRVFLQRLLSLYSPVQQSLQAGAGPVSLAQRTVAQHAPCAACVAVLSCSHGPWRKHRQPNCELAHQVGYCCTLRVICWGGLLLLRACLRLTPRARGCCPLHRVGSRRCHTLRGGCMCLAVAPLRSRASRVAKLDFC